MNKLENLLRWNILFVCDKWQQWLSTFPKCWMKFRFDLFLWKYYNVDNMFLLFLVLRSGSREPFWEGKFKHFFNFCLFFLFFVAYPPKNLAENAIFLKFFIHFGRGSFPLSSLLISHCLFYIQRNGQHWVDHFNAYITSN